MQRSLKKRKKVSEEKFGGRLVGKSNNRGKLFCRLLHKGGNVK